MPGFYRRVTLDLPFISAKSSPLPDQSRNAFLLLGLTAAIKHLKAPCARFRVCPCRLPKSAKPSGSQRVLVLVYRAAGPNWHQVSGLTAKPNHNHIRHLQFRKFINIGNQDRNYKHYLPPVHVNTWQLHTYCPGHPIHNQCQQVQQQHPPGHLLGMDLLCAPRSPNRSLEISESVKISKPSNSFRLESPYP